LSIVWASVGLSKVWLRGSVDTVAEAGIASFTDVSVTGPLGTGVGLKAHCTVGANRLVDLFGNVTIQSLTPSFVNLPKYVVPYQNIDALAVEILNRTGDRHSFEFMDGSSLLCTLGISLITPAFDAPSVFLSGKRITSNDANLSSIANQSGIVVYTQVSLAAPFGTELTFRVECWLGEHALPVLTQSATVQRLAYDWHSLPSSVLPNEEMAPVVVEITNHSLGRYMPSLADFVITVQIVCHLSVIGEDAFGEYDSSRVYLSGVSTTTIDGSGLATFSEITPVAPMGVQLHLRVQCDLGQYEVVSAQNKTRVTIDNYLDVPAEVLLDANVLMVSGKVEGLKNALAGHFRLPATSVSIGPFFDPTPRTYSNSSNSSDSSDSSRRLATSTSSSVPVEILRVPFNLSVVEHAYGAVAMRDTIESMMAEIDMLLPFVAAALNVSTDFLRFGNHSLAQVIAALSTDTDMSVSTMSFSSLVPKWLHLDSIFYINQRTVPQVEIVQEQRNHLGEVINSTRIPLDAHLAKPLDIECAITIQPTMNSRYSADKLKGFLSGQLDVPVVDGIASFDDFFAHMADESAGDQLLLRVQCHQRFHAQLYMHLFMGSSSDDDDGCQMNGTWPLPALYGTITAQKIDIKWKYADVTTVAFESYLRYGTDDAGDVLQTKAGDFLTVILLNRRSGVAADDADHTSNFEGDMNVQCKLSIWEAGHLWEMAPGEYSIASGIVVNQNETYGKVVKPPALVGKTVALSNTNGAAMFPFVSIDASVGTQLRLQVNCNTEYGLALAPINSKVMTVITASRPLWYRPPPATVIPSVEGTENYLGSEYGCGATADQLLGLQNDSLPVLLGENTGGQVRITKAEKSWLDEDSNACVRFPRIMLMAMDALSSEPYVQHSDYITRCVIDAVSNNSASELHTIVTGEEAIANGGYVDFNVLSIGNADYGDDVTLRALCYSGGVKHVLAQMAPLYFTSKVLELRATVVNQPRLRHHTSMHFAYHVNISQPNIGLDNFTIEIKDTEFDVPMVHMKGMLCTVRAYEKNSGVDGAVGQQVQQSIAVFDDLKITGESVGRVVTVVFDCSIDGTTKVPGVGTNVRVAKCNEGYEPYRVGGSTQQYGTSCQKCTIDQFSHTGEKCWTCPTSSKSNVEVHFEQSTPGLLDGHKDYRRYYHLAEEGIDYSGSGWKLKRVGTFCQCEPSFFATADYMEPEPSNQTCTPCPDGSFCALNGTLGETFYTIKPDLKFWQVVEYFYERQYQHKLAFFRCKEDSNEGSFCTKPGRSNVPEKGRTTGATCREFHTGPLCDACQREGDDGIYYMKSSSSDGMCKPCTAESTQVSAGFMNVLFYGAAGACLAALFAVLVLYRSYNKLMSGIKRLQKHNAQGYRNMLKQHGLQDKDVEVDSGKISQKIKIMIGLAQVVGQFVGSYPVVPWPADFSELTENYSIFQLDIGVLADAPNVACVMQLSYMDKFYMQTLAPLIFILCIKTVDFIANDTLEIKHFFLSKQAINKIIIFLLFLVYPGCCNQVFQILHYTHALYSYTIQSLYTHYTLTIGIPDPALPHVPEWRQLSVRRLRRAM
jgi:hypothetical protein